MAEHLMRQSLSNLNNWQQQVFCTAIAERMHPNFALFSRLTEFGEAVQQRRILDGLWESFQHKEASMNFGVQLERLETQLPDPDQFDMYGVYPAMDAVLALTLALQVVLESDSEYVLECSSLSRECVATFIEVTSSSDDEISDEQLVRMINTHELMEQEDTFQETLLLLIEKAHNSSERRRLLTEIRELAHNEGVSNIGIEDEVDE